MINERYIFSGVKKDLESKIVLIGGPRQVGKTTLSKSIFQKAAYLNFDIAADRPTILKAEWPRDVDLVILDELHKLRKWKTFLKGLYDDTGARPRLLVTGSARLDIAKKMGDSLAGRHFYWKLHPLCCKELRAIEAPSSAMKRIMTLSGFPEPYFANEEVFYKRWSKTHLDIILRQDLLDLESVSDIVAIETLIELLSRRVGQVVSYESLAEDLQRSPTTVKRWVTLLENLFVIFRVTPWSKNIARSLLKAPKFYFFDCARVQGDAGAKFENFVACSLLKEIDYANDSTGSKLKLNYLRDLEKHELDFVINDSNRIQLAIEAKFSDDNFAPGFKAFSESLMSFGAKGYQLVANLHKEKESKFGTKIVDAAEWLSLIDLAAVASSSS